MLSTFNLKGLLYDSEAEPTHYSSGRIKNHTQIHTSFSLRKRINKQIQSDFVRHYKPVA